MTVYRQKTRKLQISRGPGKPDLVSVRPRHKKSGVFQDSDEKPTLVEFDEHCRVDLEFLQETGAIVEYTPPIQKARKERG